MHKTKQNKTKFRSFLHLKEMHQYSGFNIKVFQPMEIRQISSQLVKKNHYMTSCITDQNLLLM